MKEYVILRGNKVITVNSDHEHLANATTIARAESKAHPRAEVLVVRLVTAYRNGIEVIAQRRRRHYHYRNPERRNEK